MQGDLRRIGLALALEIAPASLFAASVGFAAAKAGAMPLAMSASAGAVAFLVAWAGLRRIGGGEAPIEMPAFTVDPLPQGEFEDVADEPVDALPLVPPEADEVLLLDDVLGRLPSDSRVVRLFDAAPIPTAGELQARIDQHLRGGSRPVAPADATQELHEALDQLRRSLR